MKEDEILSQGIIKLKETLVDITFFKNILYETKLVNEQSNRADLIVSSLGKEYNLAVYAKYNGQPRNVREAVNALLRIQNENPSVYGIVIAPYISEQSAIICKEAGVGYLDLSGNCRLSFINVYIQKEGKPNKNIIKRTLSSLYSPKSERILRVLLTYPYRPWRMIELAHKASVSLGLISYVKKHLADREWIQVNADGFALSQPEMLLEEWSENYSFRRNKIFDYYTILSKTELREKLIEVCSKNKIAYGLTGFSAADHYAPTVYGQREMVYISDKISVVTELLMLKPVASGANVTLFEPYDEGIFWDSRKVDGILSVTPIQVYLDLKKYRGRGAEAAETLYREVIEKQWSKQKITMNKL